MVKANTFGGGRRFSPRDALTVNVSVTFHFRQLFRRMSDTEKLMVGCSLAASTASVMRIARRVRRLGRVANIV
jgi:hypothetical protein